MYGGGRRERRPAPTKGYTMTDQSHATAPDFPPVSDGPDHLSASERAVWRAAWRAGWNACAIYVDDDAAKRKDRSMASERGSSILTAMTAGLMLAFVIAWLISIATTPAPAQPVSTHGDAPAVEVTAPAPDPSVVASEPTPNAWPLPAVDSVRDVPKAITEAPTAPTAPAWPAGLQVRCETYTNGGIGQGGDGIERWSVAEVPSEIANAAGPLVRNCELVIRAQPGHPNQ